MFLYRLYFQINEIYEANKNTYLKQIFFIFSEVIWCIIRRIK